MKISHDKTRILLKLLACGMLVSASLAFVVAERSRAQLPSRRVITLKAGADLQAALGSARFGDTIVLPAGSTFVGPIILPFKAGGSGTDVDYITIRTSDLSAIAPDGERLKLAEQAHALAKIVAPNEKAALSTEPRAHHYKFVGVEFLPAANANYVYNDIYGYTSLQDAVMRDATSLKDPSKPSADPTFVVSNDDAELQRVGYV